MIKLWGIILIAFGCMAILVTFFLWPEFTNYLPAREIEEIQAQTARIYDDTRNAFYRGMLWDGGWNSVIVGAIFYSIGALLERLEHSGVISPIPEAASAEHSVSKEVSCAWCNQTVHEPLVPCSDISPDNRRELYSNLTNEKCLASVKENDPASLA